MRESAIAPGRPENAQSPLPPGTARFVAEYFVTALLSSDKWVQRRRVFEQTWVEGRVASLPAYRVSLARSNMPAPVGILKAPLSEASTIKPRGSQASCMSDGDVLQPVKERRHARTLEGAWRGTSTMWPKAALPAGIVNLGENLA